MFFVATDRFANSSSTVVLSLKDGERMIEDRPLTETKEQIGGFFVVDVADLDAALSWAEKCPVSKFGKIEIRQSIMPISNAP